MNFSNGPPPSSRQRHDPSEYPQSPRRAWTLTLGFITDCTRLTHHDRLYGLIVGEAPDPLEHEVSTTYLT